MAEILKMSPELASKVAAGEVVTRPLNVVKELVENSLDAGATTIVIELEQGGKRSIVVQDNGSGMDKEDLGLCVQSHATSKLKAMEDFMSLTSFGFRGEALPSICAVSKFTIESRRVGSEHSWTLEMEGMTQLQLRAGSLNQGTRVCVRQLFFNLPARLKFLKTDAYEKALIVDLVQCFMASRPDVSFHLMHNGDQVLKSDGSGKQGLLPVLFPARLSSRFFELKENKHPILGATIDGYLSQSDTHRSSSKDLKVFVNGRIVRHMPFSRAIQAAYENLTTLRRWPMGIFFLNIRPSMLDVNVHPQKTEIRIENEAILCEFITKSVRKTLLSYDQSPQLIKEPGPLAARKQERKNTEEMQGALDVLRTSSPVRSATGQALERISSESFHKLESRQNREEISAWEARKGTNSADSMKELESKSILSVDLNEEILPMIEDIGSSPLKLLKPESKSVQELDRESKPPKKDLIQERFNFEDFELVGQLENTFVVGKWKDQLVLIDQHVAQERVLYEQVVRILKERARANRQKLLIPAELEVNAALLAVASENEERLFDLGFEFEIKDEKFLLKTLPKLQNLEFQREDFEELLLSMETNFASSNFEDYIKEVAETIACKSSIKAGDELCEDSMMRLMEELGKSENPYHCPHGRPIIVKMSLKEIFSRFDRAYRPL